MNKIIQTADGSNTLFNETIGENYHSKHGALQESLHVFVDAGLKKAMDNAKGQALSVLEIGFGTGLNYLLSLNHCVEAQQPMSYTGIEAFPISLAELNSTEYGQYVPVQLWNGLIDHYEQVIGHQVTLFENQQLEIALTTLADFKSSKTFDLIYFDAFPCSTNQKCGRTRSWPTPAAFSSPEAPLSLMPLPVI